MNLNDAIKAHTVWKMKLSSYVAKPDHSLNANTVASPDACELGKWLAGDGKKYSNVPEFTALVASHSRFHKAAAEIIRNADAGQVVSPELALSSKGPFSTASHEVVKLIMAMQSKM